MTDNDSIKVQVTQPGGSAGKSGDDLQKALLKAQQEVVPEGILIVDEKGKIFSRNRQFISMWNIPEPIATSDDEEDVLAYLRTLVRDPLVFATHGGSEKGDCEEIILTDNRVIERFGKPVVGEDNVAYGWIWVFRDISAYKNAERALRHSESRYQNFIRQSTEGIWRFELAMPVDITTPVASQIKHFFEHAYLAECNDAMARMYGYTKAEELVGKRLSDFFPVNDETEQYLTHFIENKYRVDGAESKELDKDGNTIYFVNNLVGVVENGSLVRAWGTQRDITSSVLAKHALMQSEARFRNILEQTPEPMIVLKGENMVVDVANEPLLRTWHTDRRVIGKPLLECLPEVEGQGIMEMLLDVYRNRKIIKGHDHPVTYDRGDGVMETLYYNFIYTPYVEENDNVTGVLIISTDVTNSVLARQKLEESEKRFRSIFETAGVSIWEEDFSAVGAALNELKNSGVTNFRAYLDAHPDFVEQCLQTVRVTDVNLATLQMFEAESKEQLLGNLPSIFTRDTIQVFVDELVAIAENRTEYIAETRLHTLKGNPVYTMFHMRLPDAGRLDRVLFTLLDLTARKSAEEALQESEGKLKVLVEERTRELQRINEQLFRSNEDLQQFAHVASHDLKEPVRKIITFVDMLKAATESLIPQGSKTYLEKIERAATRMMSMVEGVLNYSTVDAVNLTKERVDLNKVIANIEYDLELPIRQQNARVTYYDLPTIEGAPVLIFQLFYNLINNSLKFKHPARDLTIDISSGIIEADGKRSIQIIVRDNGIGFENEYADKIFDTFTRLHSKDQYEGTGLGLSLCKKIVQRHHGSIRAIGQRHVGAEFYIQLPVHQSNFA